MLITAYMSGHKWTVGHTTQSSTTWSYPHTQLNTSHSVPLHPYQHMQQYSNRSKTDLDCHDSGQTSNIVPKFSCLNILILSMFMHSTSHVKVLEISQSKSLSVAVYRHIASEEVFILFKFAELQEVDLNPVTSRWSRYFNKEKSNHIVCEWVM